MEYSKSRSAIVIAAGLLIFLGFFFAIFHFAASSIGHEQFGLEMLNGCPEAKAQLGEPITKNKFGFSYGNASSTGGFGYASWRLAVKGSKTKGIFTFDAERHGGSWQLTRGLLKTDNEVIDVLASLKKMDEIDALLHKAHQESSENSFEAAEADLKTILSAGSYGASPAYAELAYIAFQRARYDECISSATKGIELDKSIADNFANRAVCYAETKQYTKALADTNSEIALRPPNGPIASGSYAMRAEIYQATGDHMHAAADAEKAIALGYKHPEELSEILKTVKR